LWGERKKESVGVESAMKDTSKVPGVENGREIFLGVEANSGIV